jgi:hypothetical protein
MGLINDIKYRKFNSTIKKADEFLDTESFDVTLACNYDEQEKCWKQLSRDEWEYKTIRPHNCYLAFNSRVWFSLNMPQKLVAIQWFEKMLSEKADVHSIPFDIESTGDNFITYEKEDGVYNHIISLEHLTNKELMGYDVLNSLLELDFKRKLYDDIEFFMKEGRVLNKQNEAIVKNLTIYVSGLNIEKNDKIEYSIKEQKILALHYNQPIELARRKIDEEVAEYVDTASHYSGYEEKIFFLEKEIRNRNRNRNRKRADLWFDKHFPDMTSEEAYLSYYDMMKVENIAEESEVKLVT